MINIPSEECYTISSKVTIGEIQCTMYMYMYTSCTCTVYNVHVSRPLLACTWAVAVILKRNEGSNPVPIELFVRACLQNAHLALFQHTISLGSVCVSGATQVWTTRAHAKASVCMRYL